MFRIILYLSLFISIQCYNYKELKKHSSVKVPPGTRVYFDISEFNDGELIEFEMTMDLFFGGDRTKYQFRIGQVSATKYSGDWESLPLVTNKNVVCDFDDECVFSWSEIKEAGKNSIYIIPLPPYGYTTWDKEIEIEHLGGLSGGAIAGIVLGCIAFVGIIAAIIGCCCCKLNPRCYTCCYTCCPCCHCCLCCCRSSQYGISTAVQISPGIMPGPVPVSVPVSAPFYPQPVPPVYPPPGVPYSSAAYI
jgi:hypothetical protein